VPLVPRQEEPVRITLRRTVELENFQ
jgi:hypothetical protein